MVVVSQDVIMHQVSALPRYDGEGWSDGQRWEGMDRKSHNQNMKTKAKGDGKRRKRENIVKNWQQCSFLLIYGGF